MASALGNVLQTLVGNPRTTSFAGLPGYAASTSLIEERLERLLAGHARRPSRVQAFGLAGMGLLGVAEVVPLALGLAASAIPMVCNLRPL